LWPLYRADAELALSVMKESIECDCYSRVNSVVKPKLNCVQANHLVTQNRELVEGKQ
jgi:hypothetical protein